MESKCRIFLQFEETVDHIVFGCVILDKIEYIFRHNNAATYLHWSICQNHDTEITDKWYEHKPEIVVHNKENNITIIGNTPVNTNGTVTANRPDIIIKDSVNSTCKSIDVTVPSETNIALKKTEKKNKFKDLKLEIQRMWHMKTKVILACGCCCTWYSEKGHGKKRHESIIDSYDRDSKDLHSGIGANPRKGAYSV